MAVAGAALEPASALGCAVCFGKSDSALAQGMNMGIFSLLIVVVFMWVGFTAFFVYLARRAATVGTARRAALKVSEPTKSD